MQVPLADSSPLPRLLFIAPTYPDTRGNGLAMRAGMWIEALSQRYRVTLLVVPVFGVPSASSERFVRQYCETIVVAPPRTARPPWQRLRSHFDRKPELLRLAGAFTGGALDALGDLEVDVVHAFRLCTAPLALAFAGHAPRRPRLQLDLDDIESLTHRRITELFRAAGRLDAAGYETEQAQRFEVAERTLIPRFDRVYVCSQLDAARLPSLVPLDAEVTVLPNAVRLPEPVPAPRTTHPFTFLFIGTLGYEPNLDALRYFLRRVWPRVRAFSPCPVLFRVVGAIPPSDLASLGRVEGVRFAGSVRDVGQEYGDADAVVVPLRAAGGTRIKVLEAFAHHLPVVSTSIGVEGIEAEPGRDLLVADDHEAFADACLQLVADPALRERLAASATDLVSARYSQETVNRLIREER